MKIKEVQDSVTDYDKEEPGNPDSSADAVKNEREIKVFNADNNDFHKSLTNSIANYQRLRETEQQSGQSMTKQIRAELITFGAGILNKLKDKLLDITEPDQSVNPQPDLIVLQSSRTNTKATLQSSKLEHAETSRIEDIYNDIFMNATHLKETIATFVDGARAPVGDVCTLAEHLADMDSEGRKIMGRLESTDTSKDNMFFIKKNSEDDSDTDIELSTNTKISETKQSIYNLLKLLKLEEEVNLLEKKLVKLETAQPQNRAVRFCEKLACQDVDKVVESDHKSAGDNLKTLSNLTYNKHSEDHSKTKIVKANNTQHKRPSFATNRKSKTFKRKDLLHRIEVLKTLQFDDESLSEGSLNECSPLKRTVFGETAYMRKTKECVITRHHHNENKQNNELMVESVMTDKSISVNPTTQSTKIRANLLTCSQKELESKSWLNLDFDKLTSATSTVAKKNSKCESLRNLASFSGTKFDDIFSKLEYFDTHVPVKKPSEVLIFDHLNPLNNVLLRPINFKEAHKYNPMKAGEKTCDPKQNHCTDKHCNQVSKNDTTRSRSRDFDVQTVTIKQHPFKPKTAHAANQRHRFSKPYSVVTKRPNAETNNITKLPKDLFQNRFSSNSNAYIKKAEKRIYNLSTDKHRYYRSVKVTPRPTTERQKISIIPKVQLKVPEEVSLADESLDSLAQKKSTKRNNDHSSKTRAKKVPKAKASVTDTKLDNNLFVQQLIADYIGFYENNNDYDTKLHDDTNFNVDPNTENLMKFSESALSFSSSKNLNPIRGVLNTSKQSTMQGMPSEPTPPKVLVFDYLNSLNNVLFTPIDATDAHTYNPRKTLETPCGFEHSHSIGIHNKQEIRNDFARDFEVRTVTIEQPRVVPRSTTTQQDQRNNRTKHSVIEDQATKIDHIKNKPEIILQDHHSSHSHAKLTRGKKHIRSPPAGKDRHLSFIVHPKPITKMQNIPSIPKVNIKMPVEPPVNIHESAHSMMPKKDNTKNTDRNDLRSKSRGRRSSKNLSFLTKVAQTKTAEQFICDYTGDFNLNNDYEKRSLNDVNSALNLESESLTAISQSGATFTLSKNLNPTKDFLATSNTDCRSHRPFTMQVTPSQVDWPPELMCTTSPTKYDSDFGVNVVAKIDTLPFMGSQECEWETSPADTWSFRLLNGRLRLTARLAHRLQNATRTQVRGDTPVLDITVATVQIGKADLLARMCARFACAVMRHIVLHEVRRKYYASDIPRLLRRCVAVVRVALRWERTMYDAKARLAYTLDKYGNLSLKVANISVRSVWEVKMHIELVSYDDSSVPCPRATGVDVLPIVSDMLVPADDVRSVLLHTPKDWGHVPSTIWRVYKLLKHKKLHDRAFLPCN